MFRRLAIGVKSYWRNPPMRIFSLLACCMAVAMSLSVTGNAGQPAASVAPTKNVEGQTAQAQHVPAGNSAVQNLLAQTAPKQKPLAQSTPGGQNAPAEGTPRLRTFPQAPSGFPRVQFDKGIYAGRNGFTGGQVCLAIQSYNFPQSAAPGKMPELESVTTCTSVTRPLMQQVRKPKARYLELQAQPEQEQQ